MGAPAPAPARAAAPQSSFKNGAQPHPEPRPKPMPKPKPKTNLFLSHAMPTLALSPVPPADNEGAYIPNIFAQYA
eukprot:CAMPEP_0118854868 /NCGR_PEP_ID=MMETSP1163-20130328/2910_1 /TAXON_ID=124430 /ORGANISM="Phaeomonas parva, Strain CCMP2877" /LENGTH=74 /DNA_ID=CAMNT_0006787653 /DNA_START=1 /DNA_END=226 /DNA_ORIENTATION=-